MAKRKLSSPPALAIVADNPKCPFLPARRPADKLPFILPEIDVFSDDKWKFECEMIGLTNWQRNRAWQIVCADPDKYLSYGQAINRVFHLWRALGAALEWERREVLAILQEHHPAVARKIMKGFAKATA